jgi:CelD/BcsL family acetyltransferase involved in cellulose biosynthesis
MRILRTLDDVTWRSYVDEHPDGNVFHTPEMYQIFDAVKGFRPSLWAAVAASGKPLALLLPVEITLMNGLLRPFTTRAVVYGSVLCAPGSEGRRALDALLQAYAAGAPRSVLFTELRNVSDMSAAQPVLKACGFAHEDHLNYLIDLHRAPEAVLQSFGRRTRKKIRRGLRRGDVRIEAVDNREGVSLCYRLLRKSYAAARVPLADRALFEAAFEILYPRGMIKLLLARIGDAYVATSAELIYKDTIYGWYSGVDRDFSSYVPNELLMWYILRWGAENDYRVYDFGGAGKPEEEYGVRDFKAKFGGELVCYGRNLRVHAPVRLAAGKAGYEIYRRLQAWPITRDGRVDKQP